MAERTWQYKRITASAVISSAVGTILHGVLLSGIAATATIQFFDYNSITTPTTPITGIWTPGAIVIPQFIPLDILCANGNPAGLVCIIAVAAADITVVYG